MVSYNSAISACEKGQQWEQALSLLLEMWASHPACYVLICFGLLPLTLTLSQDGVGRRGNMEVSLSWRNQPCSLGCDR